MAKNTMDDLRNHLFAALESLGDYAPGEKLDEEKDKLLQREIERASAICKVSQAIISGVHVELKYREMTGEYTDADKFFGKPNLSPERMLEAAGRVGTELSGKVNGHTRRIA
jgi:hypothetical protein